MSSKVKPFVAGTICVLFRALMGFGVIALDKSLGEADMLLLLDLPTVATYLLMAQVGQGYDIESAYDVRFFLTSLAVWFAIGFFVALAVSVLRRVAKQYSSTK